LYYVSPANTIKPPDFVGPCEARKTCKLQKSIYEPKKAHRSWNLHLDELLKQFRFIQNEEDKPYAYKIINRKHTTHQEQYIREKHQINPTIDKRDDYANEIERSTIDI